LCGCARAFLVLRRSKEGEEYEGIAKEPGFGSCAVDTVGRSEGLHLDARADQMDARADQRRGHFLQLLGSNRQVMLLMYRVSGIAGCTG